MRLGYVARRFGVFLLIVWMAATINFLIPRLSPANPVRERLLQAVAQGGANIGAMEDLVKSYEARFGLDQPLWIQYIRYLGDLARLDFGISITRFPTPVSEMILTALPWSIALVTVATLLAFGLSSARCWPGLARRASSTCSPRPS
jgi:peptide/nickel transport system permease protein